MLHHQPATSEVTAEAWHVKSSGWRLPQRQWASRSQEGTQPAVRSARFVCPLTGAPAPSV